MLAKTNKWYIQFSMLFDSMDFHYTEGEYYSILTTNNISRVWERHDLMKSEFRDKYKNCHGAHNSRTIISTISVDDVIKKRYDNDEWECDKTLQSVIDIDDANSIMELLAWSNIEIFRLSESYGMGEGDICDSREDENYVSDHENESKADEDTPEWKDPGNICIFPGIAEQWGNVQD
jgi:hypothetical protein